MQASSTLLVSAVVTTTVSGSLNIDAGATLSVTNVGSGSRRRMAVNRTIVAVSAASVQGTFETVVASPADACQTAQVMDTSYSSTTVSVTVQVSGDPCTPNSGGGGLSTGAIIGIAVGAAVGGILAVILIVFLIKSSRRRQTDLMNREIRGQEMKYL